MAENHDLYYLLALQCVPNLGDASAKKLIRKLGSAEAVFKEKKKLLELIPGIGKSKLEFIDDKANFVKAEKELKYIVDNNISYSSFSDIDYPDKLKHCIDGPILIFYRGNIDLKNKKIISIVGTRKITNYGRQFCEQLVEELSPLNPIIVSGFAFGSDITAQLAAVKHNLQTIGCLAHGLNHIYPKAHEKYVSKVEQNGGFITEFWSSDEIANTNFLKRNRIIAGLSEATVVIESAAKGGSLVTANIANSYSREVFAVPGRTIDKQSEGCNNLIKTNKAHLLTSAADIVYMLNWELNEDQPKSTQKQLFVELNKEEKTIHDYLLENNKQAIDDIALQCGFPSHKTATILLNMELKGVVRPLPGKLFEAV